MVMGRPPMQYRSGSRYKYPHPFPEEGRASSSSSSSCCGAHTHPYLHANGGRDQGGAVGWQRRVRMGHGGCLPHHQHQDSRRRRHRRHRDHLHPLWSDGDHALRWLRWHTLRDFSARGRVSRGHRGVCGHTSETHCGEEPDTEDQQEKLRSFRHQWRKCFLCSCSRRQDRWLLWTCGQHD
ncbi:Mannose glucose-specific lectin [Musa troglodytarum]|uniref:Mannose glucose-specific lectin n=1 Tax=Musa troglodytarum TaxID=320322 RepID=A0A9E7L8W7_9LILI|nr:Mannose glucose-specific lectin [Musa troglodytarum]